MANRTVSVKLALDIANYTGPAEKAAKATDGIGKSATQSAAQHRRGMNAIVVGAGVAAAAGALGLHQVVTAAMSFDKAMSGVAAVSNASAAELNALRDAALQAGKDTAFSASQAAEAEAELARAGVSTADILGGALRGSLDLAAAGQLDLAKSAEISAQAMNIFKLRGADVGHIADVLAAGANKSAADVGQLGDALRQGGLVAAQTGLSFEDTVGTLAAFADRALVGSDAGTSLKTMLQRLAAPATDARQMMQRLGLHVFDAAGQFVGMEKFAGLLQKSLSRLTQEQRNQALATIFGSDAVRAASILFEVGAGGVKEYTAAVNDQGAAGRMAATQLDNLAGDLEALRGSIETALIKTGSQGTGVLRGLASAATAGVNAFSDLPGPVQQAAFAFLALGTSGAGALAAFGTIAPKIREARASLEGMGKAGQAANRGIGLVGRGVGASIPVLGIAAAAWTIWSQQQAKAKQDVEDLTAAIREDSGALGENSRAAVVNKLERDGVLKSAEDMGVSSKTLTDAIFGEAAAQQALGEGLRSGKGDRLEVIAAYERYRKQLTDGQAASTRMTEAEGKAAAAAKAHGQAAAGATVSLEKEKSAAERLATAINALNETNLTAAEADIRYRDSVAALTQAFKDNGRTIDLNTQKGRENRGALIASIRAASTHAQAVANQTGSVSRGNAAFAAHITQLRGTMKAAGLTKHQIDGLIRKYAAVPKSVSTTVKADDKATGVIQRVTRELSRLPGSKTVTVTAIQVGTISGSGGKRGNAEGGWLRGGVAGVDSIPLANGELGMPGEFIVNAKDAQKNAGLLEAINAGRWRPAAAASGSVVSIAEGAFQVRFSGPITQDTLPAARRMVREEFDRFRAELAAGRRR